MKLHLIKEDEETKWIIEHPIFTIIFMISVSVVLVLLSMGFENGFVGVGADEMSIFFSNMCMFMAGMYFVGFIIALIELRKKNRNNLGGD